MSFQGMLADREARWLYKQRLAAESGESVVCLTLRMPQAARVSQAARAFFETACVRLEAHFAACGVEARRVFSRAGEDGPFCVWLSPNAADAKRAAMRFEDGAQGGALTDIDVMKPNCAEISRAAFGRAPRACLVCGLADARACIAQKRHTTNEILAVCEAEMKRAANPRAD